MMCTRCGFESASGMRFCGRCGSPLTDAEDPGTEPAGTQRRHLTVLFSDIVGSTVLAERLDPEDFRDLLSGYHAACTKAVERYGGYLAQFQGDGVIAYFGYPQAHEDDAARAVTTGAGGGRRHRGSQRPARATVGVGAPGPRGHRQRHRDNRPDGYRPGARATLGGRRRTARRGAGSDRGSTRDRRGDDATLASPATSRLSRSARNS